jgi:hypothetical protein
MFSDGGNPHVPTNNIPDRLGGPVAGIYEARRTYSYPFFQRVTMQSVQYQMLGSRRPTNVTQTGD